MAIGNALSERWYYASNGDLVRAQRGIYSPGGSGGDPGGTTEFARREAKFGSFLSGTYTYGQPTKEPQLADVGVYPDSDTIRTSLENNSPSTQTVIVTAANTTWQNLNVYGDVKIRAANFTAINCKFFGGPQNLSSGAETGIVDCNNIACVNAYFKDCSFIPQKPDFMRNAILGHKYTAERCYSKWGTDGFGAYAMDAPGNDGICGVNIVGCYVHDLVYWANDPAHNDGTHNDCIQYQGGDNFLALGNHLECNGVRAIWGSTNLIYGAPWSVSNPSIEPYEVFLITGTGSGSDKHNNGVPDVLSNGHGYGSVIILQDNVDEGTVNVDIIGNWLYNGLAALNLKPTTGGGNYTIQNNRFGRGTYYYTATSTYTIRIDSRANTAFSPALLSGGNTWLDTGAALTESTSGGIRYNA